MKPSARRRANAFSLSARRQFQPLYALDAGAMLTIRSGNVPLMPVPRCDDANKIDGHFANMTRLGAGVVIEVLERREWNDLRSTWYRVRATIMGAPDREGWINASALTKDGR